MRPLNGTPEEYEYPLTRTMFILGQGSCPEDIRWVITGGIAAFFTSEESFRHFAATAQLPSSNGATVLEGWERIRLAARHVQRCGATHVAIDPEADRAMAIPIEAFIRDVATTERFERLQGGAGEN